MPTWTPGLFVDNVTHPENHIPTIGTPTQGAVTEGTYSETADGLVFVEAYIKFGDDMNPGHGEYLMTLPLPCASPNAYPIGYGYVYQVIAGQKEGNYWLIQPVVVHGKFVTLMMTGLGQNHHVRHDHPFPMAPKSFLHWTCFYKKA